MTKKVNIDIVARDKTKRAVEQSKKGLGGIKTAALAASAALASIGAGRVISNLVRVGKEVESLQVRFKFLFDEWGFSQNQNQPNTSQTCSNFAAPRPRRSLQSPRDPSLGASSPTPPKPK